ncbi:MAG: hypothetical protein HY855_22730 [Burkholderiales bacterium]|nr:hypothetical protein [Burkholderiales bacterium]
MTTRYVKTEAGRQAIRERAQTLSRHARNLLLIIDSQRPADEWVGLVQGSGQADLQQLLDAGLIEPAAAPLSTGPGRSAAARPQATASAATPPAAQAAAAPAASGAAVPAPSDAPAGATSSPPLAERLQAVGYRPLYDTMTAQARPMLGLIKGYRMVLEVEKCSGPDELRVLALRFVDDVRAAQGPEAAQRVIDAFFGPG